ncbi:MAG TPA: hypothetical protein VHT05_14660 [Candidatus Elarobacter sp.]|jgi:hypothetical protein|nr:hypothetical protein [Candidatus Elarobacter sp.]
MLRTIASVTALLALAGVVPAFAATPAQAALAATVAYEHGHGTTDIEHPSCYLVPGYAQCFFATAGGNLGKWDWLALRGGRWVVLGGEGGNPAIPYMKKYGLPASVIAKFEAQCKC